jgi:hypothetical protein
MKDRVKEAEMTDRTTLKQQAFQKEILMQYPHEVYAEKIKGMDPLEASTDAIAVR